MEPPTPAATLAMTSSKAGWGSSSKAHHFDMMIIPLNQVDKMCPGEPEKVFHVDAEFFLSLLLQFPLRLQVITDIGLMSNRPTNKLYSAVRDDSFLLKLNCPAKFEVKITLTVCRRSDQCRSIATSGGWSILSQNILDAANTSATLSTSFRCFVCTQDDLRDIIFMKMFSIRIMGSTQHIGYGGLTQQTSGPALKWFDPSLLLLSKTA